MLGERKVNFSNWKIEVYYKFSCIKKNTTIKLVYDKKHWPLSFHVSHSWVLLLKQHIDQGVTTVWSEAILFICLATFNILLFSHSSDNRFFWNFCMEIIVKLLKKLTNFVPSRNIKTIRWCAVVAKNQQKITYEGSFMSRVCKSYSVMSLFFMWHVNSLL